MSNTMTETMSKSNSMSKSKTTSNSNTMSEAMSNSNTMSKTMSDSITMSKTNTMSKGDTMSNNSRMSNSMNRVCNSMSNWVSNSVSIGSNTIIGHISNITIIIIGMVVDMLGTAIRKVDRVRSLHNTVTIIGLSLVKSSTRVVISNSIGVSVRRRLIMKAIFEDFAKLSGLEINEKKTKVIRIGAKLDDTKPITNKVKFVYTKVFKLLGVDLDNKLELLWTNFEKRKKKIRTKIAIWRKLNLSELGNLIVSKTFLISQLGYLLSMLECPADLMKTIQTDIDRFIFRTGGDPWMSVKRRYLPPSEGGMGAINIETYANSLRCSWYKRIKSGLWSNILLAKVNDEKNVCYIQTKDIHKMHISILPIVKAFEALQSNYIMLKGDKARMNTPLDQLALVKPNNNRRRSTNGTKPPEPHNQTLTKTVKSVKSPAKI